MSSPICHGLIDYLDILRMAGVADLTRPVTKSAPLKRAVEIPVAPKPEVVAAISVSPGETPNDVVVEKPEALRLLAEEVSRCLLCTQLARTRTQTVFGVGNPDSRLVFVGEAPGADEDRQGEPFVGRAGQLLNDIISKGMKLRREDVYICNILRCRPPENRNPLPNEAANCRSFLDRTLNIVKPEFICCLGTVAAQNLLKTDRTIGSMRGRVLDYRGIKVVCTYHPAYLLRSPAMKAETWKDIQLLMREMGLPIPPR